MTVAWRSLSPWTTQFDLRSLIGPWGEAAEVELGVFLTTDERAALEAFGAAHGHTSPTHVPETLTLKAVIAGEIRVKTGTPDWIRYLAAAPFAAAHPFANLDYLPADRGIQRGEQAQVNPAMLSAAQTEGLRQQVLNSFVQQRQILTLTGIQPFLASLDYLDMLSDREGRPRSGDFEAIADPFFQATGKRIHRPVIDPAAPFGATLSVETPSGARHSIDQLSSGEQEVLALMFYVRRLSAHGGLLLVDEPELHLHPTLQQSLFAVMENIAERAQVWIVTHSPKLVSTAPLGAVLHMSPTDGTDKGQLTKASDEEDRGRLMSDLGVHPIDVLQSDSLVVVEGEMDARRLQAALYLTLSRAAIYIAGNAAGVEATARTLSASNRAIPWLAVRDRDLLPDEEVARLVSAIPELHVWPTRMLENELLYPSLVSRTLVRAGVDRDEDQVRERLKQLADLQTDEILADLVELRLLAEYPYPTIRGENPLETKRRFLEARIESTARKLDKFDQVEAEVSRDLDARWERDWFKLMHGKRVLGQYVRATPFRSQSDFVSALTHTLREEPDCMPPGLSAFRERMDQLRSFSGSESLGAGTAE